MYTDVITDNIYCYVLIIQLGGAYCLEISNKCLLNSQWLVTATTLLCMVNNRLPTNSSSAYIVSFKFYLLQRKQHTSQHTIAKHSEA